MVAELDHCLEIYRQIILQATGIDVQHLRGCAKTQINFKRPSFARGLVAGPAVPVDEFVAYRNDRHFDGAATLCAGVCFGGGEQLFADAGALQRLPRRLPYNIAMEMLLLGRRMGADEAARYGLATTVLP